MPESINIDLLGDEGDDKGVGASLLSQKARLS